ncbi:Predicted thiol-disulfide oxidoreductase YuxK, DCC family [Alteribacillus persepolensis]|uniref:Predicted thiol-disulfide oxidoreductase YuxK, DCC family n=1 Tax=Alteribacillus persepolensis TaxID=568899 RepID=A0A1G8E2J0_9BACI|nr:DUF393 domain-containing protein [Alteribacillus persepolensis]SDH64104.1 Predicted thiol-disulfide oxidoreductase YuxK, DCC family [Alteribacillus persepolensis]
MARYETSFIVFYDGTCELCQRTKYLLKKWDTHKRLTFQPIQDPSVMNDYPFLKKEQLQKEMHLLESHTYVYTGYAAVKRIMKLLPMTKIVTPILCIPGTNWLGRFLYQRVASNRYQLSGNACRNGGCQINRSSFDRNS